MAYDLAVGASNKVRDNPVIVGSISLDEYPTVNRLAARTKSSFLTWLSNLMVDHSFSLEELAQAQKELFALLTEDLENQERAFVYKMTAIVSYALEKQEPLHGVAD